MAGITCGHFLVPFWTFFGATLIGKAIIKTHIQKLFVIIAFSESLVETALAWLNSIPVLGVYLQAPFRAILDDQSAKLHAGPLASEKANIWATLLNSLITTMLLCYVVSMINTLAKNHHRRINKCKKCD